MPLPLPNLDNRHWKDLVDEALSVIPRQAPGWTDHNASDPGVTLLELFAWLSESAIFRLNQIPERHRWKYLKLIGFAPHPPIPARGPLQFAPPDTLPAFQVPRDTVFTGLAHDRSEVGFSTLRSLDVSPVGLAALLVDSGNGSLEDQSEAWRAGLMIEPFGRNPSPGSAFYLGFRHPPAGAPLTLAFLSGGLDDRSRIADEEAARLESCRWPLPESVCEEEAESSAAGTSLLLHHSVRLAWEVYTATGWLALTPVTTTGRPELGQVMDETRALTLDGVMELWLPAALESQELAGGEALYYLRCRLSSGAYDRPPRLVGILPNAVFAHQVIRKYGRFPFAAGASLPAESPAIGTVAKMQLELDDSGEVTVLNLLEPASTSEAPELVVAGYLAPEDLIPGHIILDTSLIARGTGRPAQQVRLHQPPVLPDSLELFTMTGDVWQQWAPVSDLDASRRTDAHCVLDAESGELTFGDGERGRVLPHNAWLLARYNTTRAEDGSLPAHTINSTGDDPFTWQWIAGLDAQVREVLPQLVTNPFPSVGGSPEETISQVAGRALEVLHAHERLLALGQEARARSLDEIPGRRVRSLPAPTCAVNLLDLERLALDVPGTHVARARALPAYHPGYPCLTTPGVVTVVILPYLPVGRPQPSLGLRAAVQWYLERRRMLGSAVIVTGPKYTEVNVEARVQLKPFANAVRVREALQSSLQAFLDPLVGGPNGLGWPFGRSVYRSEILQRMDTVPGVEHVLSLSISAQDVEGQCGNMEICPTGLVTIGKLNLVVT
jgi:hypothetical protein